MIDTSGANCFDERRWRRIADLSTSPGACRPVENHSVNTEPHIFSYLELYLVLEAGQEARRNATRFMSCPKNEDRISR
jgi:hypothetical protein